MNQKKHNIAILLFAVWALLLLSAWMLIKGYAVTSMTIQLAIAIMLMVKIIRRSDTPRAFLWPWFCAFMLLVALGVTTIYS